MGIVSSPHTLLQLDIAHRKCIINDMDDKQILQLLEDYQFDLECGAPDVSVVVLDEVIEALKARLVLDELRGDGK